MNKQTAHWQKRADLVLEQGRSAQKLDQQEYAEYCFSKSRQFQEIAERCQATHWQKRADLVLEQGRSAQKLGQQEYAEYCFSKSRQFQEIAERVKKS